VISALIPTLGGQSRLDRNLGSVRTALETAGEGWEILIVDDGGGSIVADGRGMRVISLPENRGYGPAVNAAASSATGDHVLVLNDDVRLEPDTVAKLRRRLTDPDVFAVVPSILSPLAACGDEGGKTAEFRAGLVEIREAPSTTLHPTFFAVGCCFLCPRALWQQLGGYDPAFAPFLWEDVDLSYRAWRRGFRVLHDPSAVCHHEGSATLNERRTLGERERISFRNRVLFHLRNLREPELRAEVFGALAAYALFEERKERLSGLEEALAVPWRDPAAGVVDLSDREILERVRPR
jgi:GT2 family glycosyltransferase